MVESVVRMQLSDVLEQAARIERRKLLDSLTGLLVRMVDGATPADLEVIGAVGAWIDHKGAEQDREVN